MTPYQQITLTLLLVGLLVILTLLGYWWRR
jgi:hypothetical protein